MSEANKTTENAAVNTTGMSFLRNTVSIDYAVHKETLPNIFSTVHRVLNALDKDAQTLEEIISVGTVITVGREKFNVPASELKRLAGAEAWEELEKIASGARAYLEGIGFKKVVNTRPAVFIAPTGNEFTAGNPSGKPASGSAAAMVQPSSTVSRDGGMTLEKADVVPSVLKTGKSEKADK